MRKLASIQRIDALRPIPDADAIEVADVLGWHVVVKKDEFEVGDLCVYCEVDSLLPEKPEFEFLRHSKFRIRTVKLRGQVSQGICFPMAILPVYEIVTGKVGDDVTELLGITKYEPPVKGNAGTVKGNFPTQYVPKTDEERIQNIPEILQHPDAKEPLWVATEKLDGQSFTAYWRDGEFGVCSRNLELDLSDQNNNYVSAANLYNLRNRLAYYGKNIAVQAEIIGCGIQKNKYNLGQAWTDRRIRVFTIFDINAYKRMNFEDFMAVANELDLETVPIVSTTMLLPDTVDELIEMSKGMSLVNPNVMREGIVIRHKCEPVSFKAINPDFLLKHKE